MLLRNIDLAGKSKLGSRQRKNTFLVIGIPCENMPVDEIQRQGPRNDVKMVHHNLLVPFVFIPSKEP